MGFGYFDTWSITDDLEIGYVIKCISTGVDVSNVKIEDLWVGVNECSKLLGDAGKRIKKDGKGPSFKHLWTVAMGGKCTTFCPITEFIYHAALKSTSKHSRLFRDILNSLVSASIFSTLSSENSNKLYSYEEVESKYIVDFPPVESVKMDLDDEDYKLSGIASEKKETREPKDEASARSQKHVYSDDDYDESGYTLLEPVIKTENYSMKIEPEYYSESETHLEEVNETKPKRTPTKKRPKKLICPVCGAKQTGKVALYKHCLKEHPDDHNLHPPKPNPKPKAVRLTQLHERGEVLTCCLPDCGCSFIDFKGLVRHERTHNGAYICIICGKPCYSAEALIDHCDSVHKEKSQFVCRVCGFFTHMEYKLKAHQEERHMDGLREYICDTCGFKTSSKNAFSSHTRMHEGKVYMCDECGKEFNSPQTLHTHKKTHNVPSERQLWYNCSMCDKRFTCASLLARHKRVHTGEKPFRCEECGQMFGSSSSLIKHRNYVHVDEEDRPFKCDECGKTFSKEQRTVYLGHVKQHSGIRDHVCAICHTGFSSRAYLGKHIKKVHKLKIIDVEKQVKRIQAQTIPVFPNATKLEND